MTKIHVLDSLLSNQIAAGEVIERPASVVKELVENAIDAGASKIDITIEGGGIDLIRIRDNGSGMSKEDLPQCILRHATSKVASYDDLMQVQTLGFRGEALASIASVAKLNITSAQVGQSEAWQLTCYAGKLDELKPAAHPSGTTIEMRELFFNTPARRKFLRAAKTEYGHIDTVLRRIALVCPTIQFTLTHNQQQKWRVLPASDARSHEARLLQLIGQGFVEKALDFDCEASGMRLSGWLALPEYNRAQMDQQYMYVNGRFVKDKLLIQAMRQAYQSVMFHGRYAAFVVMLDCDPRVVDVNVHPTKHEVRFRDGRSIFQFIQRAVSDALASVRLQDRLPIDNGQEHFSEGEEVSQSSHLPRATNMPASLQRPMPVMSPPSADVQAVIDKIHQPQADGEAVLPSVSAGAAAVISAVDENCQVDMTQSVEQVSEPVRAQTNKPQQLETVVTEPAAIGTVLAQLHDTYILAQNRDGLVVVDMHAAHERVLFEMLKEQIAEGGLARQRLLIPVEVSLSEAEMLALESQMDTLLSLGVELDALGERSVLVRQVPTLLHKADWHRLIRDIAEEVCALEHSQHLENVLDRLLANMACKAAVKANHRMALAEMQALLTTMGQIPHGGLCNHGRPAYHVVSLREIDKWFLRGQ
jgi:DNA mismatch repair protein MutL